MRFVSILLVILTTLGTISSKKRIKGVQWWSLANAGKPSNDLLSPHTQIYSSPNLLPLTKRQRALVTKNPGTILAVMKSARMAIDECQYQFRNRRWNCPTVDNSHGGSVFGKILQKGCRETSFIYAITSAAVTHSVARACSEGSIYTCTCDNNLRQMSGKDWEWGGCSDNGKFGHKFSRRFVDVVEKGRDFRHKMNLHNNGAGRKQVTAEMTRECKCHGMSGDCTIKTCWMRLPTFRTVGDLIKDRFDGASRVLPGNAGSTDTEDNAVANSITKPKKKRRKLTQWVPTNPNHKPPGRKDLVYFDNSPSFCERDSSIGFTGTTGRECNGSSIGIDGCDLMCCGRGHKTESYVVRKRCSCTFHWCCDVKCKVCTKTELRHTCL